MIIVVIWVGILLGMIVAYPEPSDVAFLFYTGTITLLTFIAVNTEK